MIKSNLGKFLKRTQTMSTFYNFKINKKNESPTLLQGSAMRPSTFNNKKSFNEKKTRCKSSKEKNLTRVDLHRKSKSKIEKNKMQLEVYF